MKRLFSFLFKKYEYRHYTFYTGTDGLQKHQKFIDDINKENVEIINSYILYHNYSDSHKPATINYVIKFKKQ